MATEDGGLRKPAVEGVREQDGAIVVVLQGELDLYNVESVSTALGKAAASGPRHLVVDLTAVEFLDSTVIAALVEARKRAGEGIFSLAGPTAQTRRVLEVAGVDRYLDIHESVEDALR